MTSRPCRNCGLPIRYVPTQQIKNAYWVHEDTGAIHCSPQGTKRAEPTDEVPSPYA